MERTVVPDVRPYGSDNGQKPEKQARSDHIHRQDAGEHMEDRWIADDTVSGGDRGKRFFHKGFLLSSDAAAVPDDSEHRLDAYRTDSQ